MTRFRPAVLAFALLSTPAGPLAAGDDPLMTTLQEVKTSYAAKRFDQADAALRRLSELIAAPERASARPRILPAFHFYSAAVAFQRKDEDRARTDLRRFLDYQPDATIDPALYPKSFCIFFEAQRTEKGKAAIAGAPAGPEATAGGILPNYARSDFDASAIPFYSGDPGWPETPVKFLLTEDDRKGWRRLVDEGDRRLFVEKFWRRYDLTPETPDNDFQVEFYRRAQYADANFSTEQTRGSLTDRGMVFLILGPPTYVGRAPLLRSQDMMNVLRTTEITMVPSLTGGASLQRLPSNRSSVTPGDIEGEVETWYYRRDRLPRGIGFQELQYQFVSRPGYGTAVLQKEARELNALGQAARLLKKGS